MTANDPIDACFKHTFSDLQQVKKIIPNRTVYLCNTFLSEEKKLLRETHTKSRMLRCANAALGNHFSFQGFVGGP